MKKLVFSLVFIIAGFFIVDYFGGKAMWWVSQNTQDIVGPKLKYLVNDVDEDVILMGTSRCNFHYVPSVISDSLGISVYNAGIDASHDIFSHYILLNHILAHHSPKVIVLDVRNGDLIGECDFNSVSFFAPYFGRNAYSDSVMRLAGKYEAYKLSHLYRFNAKAPNFILGLAINKNKSDDHGYHPSGKPRFFPDTLANVSVTMKPDTLKTQYLQRFVNRCREHEVTLIFSISPTYKTVDSSFYSSLRYFANKNEIPLFDYHTPGMFHDCPECFKDAVHLWDSSARVFSSHFAHDLKLYLEK